MSVITLLTDFGSKDEYVGVMKGVILSINPSVAIVDISHHIEPQNVTQAAYMLAAAYPYFPAGTVYIVVVDPGVGSDRPIIAVETAKGVFIAPDNGALSAIMDREDIEAVVRVENSRYFLSHVGHTFHGRDIFAPVGAHLAGGLEIHRLGPAAGVTDSVRLHLPKPRIVTPEALVGTVIAIDRFGNLTTCIDSAVLDRFSRDRSLSKLRVYIGRSKIVGLRTSYRSVPVGHPLAIVGSRGLLEIGVNRGSAEGVFEAKIGHAVTLAFRDKTSDPAV